MSYPQSTVIPPSLRFLLTMFNLIGRNLTSSVHRLFPRSSCSSTAASYDSFAVAYLIESCGLPSEKAISASKHLKFKTADRAASVIAFFKNQGFTETQISYLVRRFPMALVYHPEKNLLPKFEFLSSIGLSGSDILKLLTARPNVLGRSLKNLLRLKRPNQKERGGPVVSRWCLAGIRITLSARNRL